MRILVTGGTGFLGSHVVPELIRTGHEVRLLARSPESVAAASEPFGIELPAYALGDVTDPASVHQAMDGCDAVLHAAGLYSLDVRAATQIREVNVQGAEAVLRAAAEQKLDPIVYVSSLGVLYPPNGAVLDASSPVKRAPGVYYEAKVDAELIARRSQEEGAAVAITYPGGIFGPHDPHEGESTQLVTNILRRRFPVAIRGGFSVVDVRDLATAHAALFEPGRGQRRYLLSGTNTPFSSMIETLAELTARRLPHVTLPGWSLRPVIVTTELLQRGLPFRLPLNKQGFDTIVWNPRGDDSLARAELGFAPRPVRETLADTAVWLYEAGRIPAKLVGKLAEAGPAPK